MRSCSSMEKGEVKVLFEGARNVTYGWNTQDGSENDIEQSAFCKGQLSR